eukprot:CAMPEP_0182855660 /NCGR_PEP_ID=MMETSP0034_2-20130328/1985_1 /TAXON_ID=156128 /ORGANISM="Nephroselmis pyriformis, Strain CCMP717" /LENGTH=78 /DNA_ID=CAMNT_0024986663 /DNA_START=78 /DNA_END=314 /DNA_ORIENTATION=+
MSSPMTHAANRISGPAAMSAIKATQASMQAARAAKGNISYVGSTDGLFSIAVPGAMFASGAAVVGYYWAKMVAGGPDA